jgi:hypothetical protein
MSCSLGKADLADDISEASRLAQMQWVDLAICSPRTIDEIAAGRAASK